MGLKKFGVKADASRRMIIVGSLITFDLLNRRGMRILIDVGELIMSVNIEIEGESSEDISVDIFQLIGFVFDVNIIGRIISILVVDVHVPIY